MYKRKHIIPNNLKECRLKCGYTQKEIAKLLGKEIENRLSRWEKGIAIPNVFNLLKLCKLYNAKVEEIYPELYLDN